MMKGKIPFNIEEQKMMLQLAIQGKSMKAIKHALDDGCRIEKERSIRSINNFLRTPRNKQIIAKARKIYFARLSDLPYAEKSSRIIAYGNIYDEAMHQDEPDLKAAGMALESIRKEIEGEGKFVVGNTHFYNFNINDDNFKKLPLNDKIKLIADQLSPKNR